MNSKAKISLGVCGGLAGFTCAFVAFSLVLGVQPHDIPVVGSIFPAPPEEHASSDPAPAGVTPPPPKTPTSEPRRAASAGLLDVFQIESPYSPAELERLVADLKRKSKELDQRLLEITERERRAAERAEFLDEQYGELQRLRTGLELWQSELESRKAEVDRDERVRAEREGESWAKLAKLFADGDAAETGRRLAEYAPEDAAKILLALKPARVTELLENVGADKWKEYAEAYRHAEQPDGE